MKKSFIAFLTILSISSAYADGGRGHDRGHDRGWGRGDSWGWGNNWVVPALIGGAIIYDLSRPQTVYVQPAPVYTQPEIIYVQPAPPYSSSYAYSDTPPSAAFWYFCADANAYYPYVTSCSSGWQAVPATPLSPPANFYDAPYETR